MLEGERKESVGHVAERSPAGADRYPVTLGLKAEHFGGWCREISHCATAHCDTSATLFIIFMGR